MAGTVGTGLRPGVGYIKSRLHYKIQGLTKPAVWSQPQGGHLPRVRLADVRPRVTSPAGRCVSFGRLSRSSASDYDIRHSGAVISPLRGHRDGDNTWYTIRLANDRHGKDVFIGY